MSTQTNTGSTPAAFPPPGTQFFDTPELHQLMLAYVKAFNTRGNPEAAYQAVLGHLQAAVKPLLPTATPSSRWKAEDKPDPHGTYYEQERAGLAKGHLSDDEMANAVYMSPGIANLTCAKERIRWLSRALDRASKALAVATGSPYPSAAAESASADASDVRGFAEFIADGVTSRQHNGYYHCTHCDVNLDSEEPHEANCLTLRARAYIEKHPAPAASSPAA